MAKEILNIIYDTETKQMMVGGLAMTNDEEKVHILETLISALNIIVHFKPTVIQPANRINIPPGMNGKPMRMTN